MADSDDSDVEFQSADEGEEEKIVKEKPVINDQNQENAANDIDTTDIRVEEEELQTLKDRNDELDENKRTQVTETFDEGIKKAVEEVDVLEEEMNTESKSERTMPKELKPATVDELSPSMEEPSIQEIDSQTETNNKVCENISVPPGEQVIGRQLEQTSQVDDSPNTERSNLQNPLDRLSEKSSSGGWGWGGWGKSFISSATSTVSGLGHGLSSAIQSVESSLGVPQPEEMARKEKTENKLENKSQSDDKKEEETSHNASKKDSELKEEEEECKAQTEDVEEASQGYSLFSFGATALTGVVGKTVSGGLGALELIGRTTMDVIQDGDPGLRRKREYFTKGNMPSLSQTLKEAAEVAEQATLKEKENEEKNRAHFGILFDKYQGLSHLEALEILSNQSEGKVHSVMATITGDQLDNLKTQMIEIKDEFKLEDIDFEEENYQTDSFVDTITEHLFTLSVAATPDKLKRVQNRAHDWLARCKEELEIMKTKQKENESRESECPDKDENLEKDNGTTESDDQKESNFEDKSAENADKETVKNIQKEEIIEVKEYVVPKEIHVKAIQTLAELTSRCIEQFHKAAELMLLQQAKEHSKNPIQRSVSLSKLTSVLCCEVSSLTSRFSELLTVAADIMRVNEDDVNPLITNTYLEGSNSMSYIQDAFQLLLPIIQVVAIEHED